MLGKDKTHKINVLFHSTNEFLYTDLEHKCSSIFSLLLKPAAQANVGKTKLFINSIRNPTSNPTSKVILNTNGLAGNTLQFEAFYILILQTSMVEL